MPKIELVRYSDEEAIGMIKFNPWNPKDLKFILWYLVWLRITSVFYKVFPGLEPKNTSEEFTTGTYYPSDSDRD